MTQSQHRQTDAILWFIKRTQGVVVQSKGTEVLIYEWPELSAPVMTDAKRQEFSTLSTSQQILFYIIISTTSNDLQ